jgi:hypothetical protein
MEAYGFVAGAAPTDADRADYPLTQIRYPAGSASKALTAAVFLGTNNVVEARPGEISGSGVVVIVGRDWDRLVAPVKRPPGPTTTVGGATTAPAVASTTTTTTTTPSPSATAVVPVDPRTGGPLVGCPG